jgi:crotonobetainyl-CoA:carnitine CoA-transferase CaiB-like acyl-CoA transferase
MMMNQTFLEGGESIGELADYFSVYKTKDGFVTIILAPNDEIFNLFCEYFKVNLHQDERFLNAGARVKNKDDLTSEITKITQEYNTKELIDLMDLHGIPASVVNQLDDIHEDPQVIEQGSLVEVEHPITGTMRMPRPPFKFLNQDNFPKKQATILGADTREVLESLGVENDHIIKIEDREEQNRILLASFNLDQVK